MPSLYNVFLRDGIMFFVSISCGFIHQLLCPGTDRTTISAFQIANIVLNKVAPVRMRFKSCMKSRQILSPSMIRSKMVLNTQRCSGSSSFTSKSFAHSLAMFYHRPSVHLNAILTGRMLIHLRSFAEKEVDMTPSGRYTLRDRVRTHRSVPSELYFRQSVSQDV